MSNLTPEIIARLKAPFAPSQHKDRELPGGGTWFYIAWQLIRSRVEEVDPDYSQSFENPQYLDQYCFVACTLTICGVSRQAIGNAKIEMLSKSGKNMDRGNCIERAIADAFKNAAESFGVAAYLDDQDQVIKIMSSHGDSRAYTYAKNQQQTDAGLPPITKKTYTPNNLNSKPQNPAKQGEISREEWALRYGK